MEPRLNCLKLAPEPLKALYGVEAYLRGCGLEHSLMELVKARVSRVNGCAFCPDMHTQDARAAGETEQRLYALSAWHETPLFTERERVALAWAEAVTTLEDTARIECPGCDGSGAPRGCCFLAPSIDFTEDGPRRFSDFRQTSPRLFSVSAHGVRHASGSLRVSGPGRSGTRRRGWALRGPME